MLGMYNSRVHEVITYELRKEFRRVFPAGGEPTVAVERLDIKIERGEIYGFLGPNGAGKTTTIKMILGLVRPSAGRVEIPGGIRRPDGKMRIGAVLEGSRNIYFRLSVRENLWYFGHLRGMKPGEIRSRTDGLLARYELSEKADKTAQTLSRGMQQKLAIAASLIHDPDILLLDEPTLGLDVKSARDIQVQMLDLAHREGKAILLTTHQMDLAQAVSDRVGIIDKGRLVAEDTVEGLMGIFKRQDYRVEIDLAYLQQAELALQGFEFEKKESKRPGKAGFLVHLQSREDIFRLTRALEGQGVVPDEFSLVVPNLEDVFLSYTGKEADGGDRDD